MKNCLRQVDFENLLNQRGIPHEWLPAGRAITARPYWQSAPGRNTCAGMSKKLVIPSIKSLAFDKNLVYNCSVKPG